MIPEIQISPLPEPNPITTKIGQEVSLYKEHEPVRVSKSRPASKQEEEFKATEGAFWGLLTPRKLVGGSVVGGGDTITVDDIELDDLDNGDHLWIRVSYRAKTTDGVLMPGGDILGYGVDHGSTVPGNGTPTAASPTQNVYIDLGSWTDGHFVPASPGNRTIRHCLGSLYSF